MDGSSTAQFIGTLVKRQPTPDRKYAQLVFKTAQGLRLCLSRNARMVQTLEVGQTYQIKGLEVAIGQRSYVREPTAKLVASKSERRKRKMILMAIVGALLLAGIASAMVYATHGAKPNSKTISHKSTAATGQVLGASSATAPVATAPAVTPTTPTSAASTSSKTTAKKTVSKTAVTTTTSPSSSDTASSQAIDTTQSTDPTADDPATPTDPAPVDNDPVPADPTLP